MVSPYESVRAVLVTTGLVLAGVVGATTIAGTAASTAQNHGHTRKSDSEQRHGPDLRGNDDLSLTNEQAFQVWVDEHGTGVYTTTDPNVY